MPPTNVYLCDKTADHGKGKPCRKVVEAGVSIELIAHPLPLEDGHQITVDRAFCNAFHAQHWLRRIAVKDLLAPVAEEVGPGINEIGESMIITSGEVISRGATGAVDEARRMAAKAANVCQFDHPHCWPHAEGETCAVPGCGHFQDDDTETTFGPIAPAYADDMHRQIYNVGDPKPKRKRAKA